MQANEPTEGTSYEQRLAAGQASLARCEWEAARAHFQAAVAETQDPAAFEGLADACDWLHDEAATFDARERAYHGYLERRELAAAARMAIGLANSSLDFRGQGAVANGWLHRGRSRSPGWGTQRSPGGWTSGRLTWR